MNICRSRCRRIGLDTLVEPWFASNEALGLRLSSLESAFELGSAALKFQTYEDLQQH